MGLSHRCRDAGAGLAAGSDRAPADLEGGSGSGAFRRRRSAASPAPFAHAGRAAEGGLLAARLAGEGLAGPSRVFEDVWGGFFRAFNKDACEPQNLCEGLGESWKVKRAVLKPYASCRGAHSAVDALDDLLSESGRDAAAIDRIELRLSAMTDCNQGFTVDEAIRRAARLRELDLAWIEEPLPADDLDGHIRLTRSTSTPIAVGESIYSIRHFREYMDAEAGRSAFQPTFLRRC